MVAMAFLLKLIAIILLLVALFAFYQSWKAKKSASNEGARQRNDPLAFAAGVSGENDFNPQVIGPGAILSRGGIDYVVRGSVTLRTDGDDARSGGYAGPAVSSASAGTAAAPPATRCCCMRG